MSRRAVLLLATMACALVVASGVALAAIIQCTGGPCTGTEEGDTITGTEGNDSIRALADNDEVFALGGNDFVDAGAGTDIVEGDEGNDTILGGPGGPNDFSFFGGDEGNDFLMGGDDGRDNFFAGPGRNFVLGQGGIDNIDVQHLSSQDDVAIASDGNDEIIAQDGTRDFVSCGAGTDFVSADEEDVVASDCENVEGTSVATGSTDQALKQRAQQLEQKAKTFAERERERVGG